MAEGKIADGAKPPSSQAENGKDGADDMEDGEIQEVDMESQAEGIRTVFNNPKDFNVKVCGSVFLSSTARCSSSCLALWCGSNSIPCIPHGHSGLILRRRKAGICPRRQ